MCNPQSQNFKPYALQNETAYFSKPQFHRNIKNGFLFFIVEIDFIYSYTCTAIAGSPIHILNGTSRSRYDDRTVQASPMRSLNGMWL